MTTEIFLDLQRMVDAAVESGSGPIHLPAGKFTVVGRIVLPSVRAGAA